MMVFTSLKQRLVVLLLVPVALLLFGMGLFGFLYANKVVFREWREASILKLQRSAHHIDMRLQKPIEWMEMFNKTTQGEYWDKIQGWVIEQLKQLEGVSKVSLVPLDQSSGEAVGQGGSQYMGMEMMRHSGSHMDVGRMEMMQMHFHHARITRITPPRFDPQAGGETVSLISDLNDQSGKTLGRLEVAVRFDYLMKNARSSSWWQSEKACLIDDSGRFLAHTGIMMKSRKKLGATNDPLELAILHAIKTKPFGTVLGSGNPPKEVSGFYRIQRAPWTLIVFGPGKKILAPVLRFSYYYAASAVLWILIILLLIRFVGRSTVRSITEISQAAGNVADGSYVDPLPVRSRDEIGTMTESFNIMMEGLKERDLIRNTFGRYVDREIARELLRRPEARRLGGEKREVAILMADLRDFTPLCEKLNPEVVIGIVNRYFSYMIDIIQRHHGIIIDFYGDAVLVFFDPLELPVAQKVNDAIRCAFAMQRAMKRFNADGKELKIPELYIGIGVNTGEVIVGNIGSEARAKYGIVGAPVNLTQRIQATAKGGEVVVSESIYRQVTEKVGIRKTFKTELKGVPGEVDLYVVGEL